MQNQPLESQLETLRRQLRFLPEQEREKEITELRSHLEERITAYESAGELPEQALSSAWQKFGDPVRYIQQVRRWYHLISPLKALAKGAYESVWLYPWVGLWAVLGWELLAGFQNSIPPAFLVSYFGFSIFWQIWGWVRSNRARDEFFRIIGAAGVLCGYAVVLSTVLPPGEPKSLFRMPIIPLVMLICAIYYAPFRVRIRIKR
jgi:hypothetical protein